MMTFLVIAFCSVALVGSYLPVPEEESQSAWAEYQTDSV